RDAATHTEHGPLYPSLERLVGARRPLILFPGMSPVPRVAALTTVLAVMRQGFARPDRSAGRHDRVAKWSLSTTVKCGDCQRVNKLLPDWTAAVILQRKKIC